MINSDEYIKFKEGLRQCLDFILVSKTPYIYARTSDGPSYRRDVYSLPPFEMGMKNISLIFEPQFSGENRADTYRSIQNCKYMIQIRTHHGNYQLAFIERRPVRKLSFMYKPYEPEDIYISGLIVNIIDEIAPSTKIERKN